MQYFLSDKFHSNQLIDFENETHLNFFKIFIVRVFIQYKRVVYFQGCQNGAIVSRQPMMKESLLNF